MDIDGRFRIVGPLACNSLCELNLATTELLPSHSDIQN